MCEQLKAFFGQSGFQSSKTSFVPVGAILGVNLVERKAPEASVLSQWYRGPTLVDLLGTLDQLCSCFFFTDF